MKFKPRPLIINMFNTKKKRKNKQRKMFWKKNRCKIEEMKFGRDCGEKAPEGARIIYFSQESTLTAWEKTMSCRFLIS